MIIYYIGLRFDTDQDFLFCCYSKAGNKITTNFYVEQGKAHSSGAITASGSITANYGSDRRLKKNIAKLTGASDVLKRLSVYEFHYTDEAMKRDVALPPHTFGLMHDEVADTRLGVIASVSEQSIIIRLHCAA